MKLHSFVMACVAIAFGLFSLASSCLEPEKTSSCTSSTTSCLCERGCQLYQECEDDDLDVSDCKRDCEDYFDFLDGSSCEDEYHDYYDCVLKLDCWELYFGEDYGDIEPDDSDLCEQEFSDLSDCNCCTAGNPCDWEDDGFCDCDGDYSWDDADCGNGCSGCMDIYCSAETAQCNANASCSNLLICMSECSTDSCQNSCMETYSVGIDDLNEWFDCMDINCSSDCL